MTRSSRTKSRRAVQGPKPKRRPSPAATPPRTRRSRDRTSPCRAKLWRMSFMGVPSVSRSRGISPQTPLCVVRRVRHIGLSPGPTPARHAAPLRGGTPWRSARAGCEAHELRHVVGPELVEGGDAEEPHGALDLAAQDLDDAVDTLAAS